MQRWNCPNVNERLTESFSPTTVQVLGLLEKAVEAKDIKLPTSMVMGTIYQTMTVKTGQLLRLRVGASKN